MARLGLDYPTEWGRRPPATWWRALIQAAFVVPYTRYMAGVAVRGRENIAGRGPFIFAANHVSHLDTPIILTALPTAVRRRTVVAAAMDNFFMRASTAARTILMFNAIPIDRHRVNRRSSDLAQEVLREGWHLLIYPEGGRSPTGRLQGFKGGAAFLAEKVGAPVIPVYVVGAGELRGPKYAKATRYTDVPWKNRHRVTVAFGPALTCAEGESIRRFNARIEDAVVALGREATGDATMEIERRD